MFILVRADAGVNLKVRRQGLAGSNIAPAVLLVADILDANGDSGVTGVSRRTCHLALTVLYVSPCLGFTWLPATSKPKGRATLPRTVLASLVQSKPADTWPGSRTYRWGR